MEMDASFYDKVYKAGGYNKMYHQHYTSSIYFPIWKKAAALINKMKRPQILDIGCGPGQFANLLFDNKQDNYTGIDFSREAIDLAKKQNPEHREQFAVGNALSADIYKQDDTLVILFEVLEHVREDIQLLNHIKSGTSVLISVPNFNSQAHVRWFSGEKAIHDRYDQTLHIAHIYPFPISTSNIIYLCDGVKK